MSLFTLFCASFLLYCSETNFDPWGCMAARSLRFSTLKSYLSILPTSSPRCFQLGLNWIGFQNQPVLFQILKRVATRKAANKDKEESRKEVPVYWDSVYQNWRLLTNATLVVSPIGHWWHFGSTSQRLPATGSINRKPSSRGHLVKLAVKAVFWLVGFNVILRLFIQSPFKAGFTFIVQVTQFFSSPFSQEEEIRSLPGTWKKGMNSDTVRSESCFLNCMLRKKKITYNFNICDCICSPSGPIRYSLALRWMHNTHFNMSSPFSSLLKIPFRKKKNQLSSSQSPRECC